MSKTHAKYTDSLAISKLSLTGTDLLISIGAIESLRKARWSPSNRYSPTERHREKDDYSTLREDAFISLAQPFLLILRLVVV